MDDDRERILTRRVVVPWSSTILSRGRVEAIGFVSPENGIRSRTSMVRQKPNSHNGQ